MRPVPFLGASLVALAAVLWAPGLVARVADSTAVAAEHQTAPASPLRLACLTVPFPVLGGVQRALLPPSLMWVSAWTPDAMIEQLTITPSGDPSTGWSDYYVRASADGRYVAFGSDASDLVPGVGNELVQVYVRDRLLNQTACVTTSGLGGAGNGDSWVEAMSPDGRFVLFSSCATDLCPGKLNGEYEDMFLHDRLLGTTVLVSVNDVGEPGDYYSVCGDVTPDGRFVAWASGATNLVEDDTNGQWDVFLRDLLLGTTERVSVDSDGQQAPPGGRFGCRAVSISGDGRYVAFYTTYPSLVEGDDNGVGDILLRDRVAGTTTLVSTNAEGVQGDADSADPQISKDGRRLAFRSYATNLVAGTGEGLANVFLKDLTTGQVTLVSVGAGGEPANDNSEGPRMTDDGRYVVFVSYARNLTAAGDELLYEDVFFRDVLLGVTHKVSVGLDDTEGDGESRGADLSQDGKVVVFDSEAENLTALTPVNGQPDIFASFNEALVHEVWVTEGPAGAPNPAASQAQVQCTVTAECSAGHDLTYLWTAKDDGGADAGTFDDATKADPKWTAPENKTDAAATYTIAVLVTCTGGKTAHPSFEQQVDPVPDAVTITEGPSGDPNPVASQGQVQCSVAAADSRDHALTYQWTAKDDGGADAGSFDDATKANPLWTAPENKTDAAVTYTLAVVVTCAKGESAEASFDQQVEPVADVVTITEGPSGDPNPAPSQGQVQCSVTASDSRDHALTYQWIATRADGKRAGSFDDATKTNPIWTAPENKTDAVLEYTISVKVTCARRAVATASFVQQVHPVADVVTITQAPSSATDPVASGAQVLCKVTASDSRGHGLSYQWTATDAAGDPVGSFDDPTLARPHWTAPVNDTFAVATVTIAVTVTCACGQTCQGSFAQQVLPADAVRTTEGPTGDADPVASSGTVHCSASAEDSLGHDLQYEWTAVDAAGEPAGRFDDRRAQNPAWTAPENLSDTVATYTIAVRAHCRLAECSASFQQQVQPKERPQITEVSLEPPGGEDAPVRSGQVLLCTGSATDSLGRELTYHWTALDAAGQAMGSFDDPTSAEAVWTPPEVSETTTVWITLTVRSDDGLETSQTWEVTLEPRIVGDVDGDGELTVADLSLFYDILRTVHFGKPTWAPGADVDHDGDVDIRDAQLLLEAFLRAQNSAQ